MLTPLDIESKSFQKSISGYNQSEVKAFLKEVLCDYEQIYKQNIEMKDKLATLQEGIQYYKNIEATLQSTLILAEKTAEETKNLARQKANQIEKEAQLKADMILNDARHEIMEINRIKEELIHSFDVNKIQMRQYLNTQLELTEKARLDNTSSTKANSYVYSNSLDKEDAIDMSSHKIKPLIKENDRSFEQAEDNDEENDTLALDIK